jgi:hypothetical protein
MESEMGFVPVMWAVWGVSFVFMACVSIFAARVGRNEEAQIFLADSSSHVKSEQDAIAARVGKLRPVKLASLGILGVMTVVVASYYVLDVLKQFGK